MFKGQWLDYSGIEFLEDEAIAAKVPCKGTHAAHNILTIQSLQESGLDGLSVSGQTPAAMQSLQAQLLFQQLSYLLAEQQSAVTPAPTTPDVDMGDALASPERVKYAQAHSETIRHVTPEDARQMSDHFNPMILRQAECTEVAAENLPVHLAASSKSCVDGRLTSIENRLAKISAALAAHVQVPVLASNAPSCVTDDVGVPVKVSAKSYPTRSSATFENAIDCKGEVTHSDSPLKAKADLLLVHKSSAATPVSMSATTAPNCKPVGGKPVANFSSLHQWEAATMASMQHKGLGKGFLERTILTQENNHPVFPSSWSFDTSETDEALSIETLSELDEWEGATTASTQHERPFKGCLQRTRFSCEDDLAMPLPFQTFNGSDTAETLSPEALSGLDEWEAATTASTQHERLAKQWMKTLIEDLTGQSRGEDSQSWKDTETCTPPFTPGAESSQKHPEQQHESEQRSGSPLRSDCSREDNQASEYLQEANPGKTWQGGQQSEEVGQELVTLLLACAEAVSTKSLSLMNHLLQKLGELASPKGTSMQRIAAYYTEGLACRVTRLSPQIYQKLPFDINHTEDETQTAFHLLNQFSPYTKFAHFTAIDIILQAFEGADRVHVIDFDVKQGLQWPALFHSLAVRPEGPPAHIRITGVGDCKEDLEDTGDRLAEFAEALNIPFTFHAVIDRLEDVRLWMLHVKESEAVAVNCIMQLHRLLYNSGESIKDFLNLLKTTRPRVVALVEQEGSHNSPNFEARFLESLQYYSAVFDSLDANLPRDSKARLQVEKLFSREIHNILACEGLERVERHETFAQWRILMSQAKFSSVPLQKRAKAQAHILLHMFGSDGYTLSEEDGTLTLGWMDQPLFTASAWTPERIGVAWVPWCLTQTLSAQGTDLS